MKILPTKHRLYQIGLVRSGTIVLDLESKELCIKCKQQKDAKFGKSQVFYPHTAEIALLNDNHEVFILNWPVTFENSQYINELVL